MNDKNTDISGQDFPEDLPQMKNFALNAAHKTHVSTVAVRN